MSRHTSFAFLSLVLALPTLAWADAGAGITPGGPEDQEVVCKFKGLDTRRDHCLAPIMVRCADASLGPSSSAQRLRYDQPVRNIEFVYVTEEGREIPFTIARPRVSLTDYLSNPYASAVDIENKVARDDISRSLKKTLGHSVDLKGVPKDKLRLERFTAVDPSYYSNCETPVNS
jgi:hypothetical protein